MTLLTPYVPSSALALELQSEGLLPCYAIHAPHLRERLQHIQQTFSRECPTEVYYAMKANPNPAILRTLREAGLQGIDAVSVGELHWAMRQGFSPEQISFTGVSLTVSEIQEVSDLGVLLNCGSLDELQILAAHAPGSEVGLRLCPAVGAGEYEVITTGQTDSKFGIDLEDFPQALQIISQAGMSLVGLHCHIGSGYYEPSTLVTAAQSLLQVAQSVPGDTLQWLNLGGGFGIHYDRETQRMDLGAFSAEIGPLIRESGLRLRLEPGKFLVGDSTALLAEVTMSRGSWRGLNSGMNHLIRPMLYGATHPAVNVTSPDAPLQRVNLVGNICESTDCFQMDAPLPDPQRGDVLAFCTAGGYGSSMSSLFNFQPYASEVMVQEDGTWAVTRQMGRGQMFESLGYRAESSF